MANKINGNTDGVKRTFLDELLTLYDVPLGQREFASFELLSAMAAFSARLNRELSVYIARDGRIVDVSIGERDRVQLPDMRLVRNADRLSGVRCIHTHPGGDGRLSSVDIGTLRSSRLDSMASLGVNAEGKPTTFYAAFIGELENDERTVLIYGPLRPYKLNQAVLMDEIILADARLVSTTKNVLESEPERAILVGIESGDGYDTIAELKELALTAGARVVGESVQRRREIDNATYIGSGKAEELALSVSALEADLLIFDDELNAIQTRNLENITHARVIDRTALILHIFAQRASSREGKLQVELAQLKYSLPRITGQGLKLSRQGAGVIARGPGETKLESDRRRIKRRIFELEQALDEIDRQRGLRRVRREDASTPLIALVGYTNAGKSTLLNAMTDAGVLAEDKLFATLDPVVRKLTLPGGTTALVSDTVGFINKLPHDLVNAFRSTLEEAAHADLILHVIDCASDYYDIQRTVVEDVLCSLGAANIARIDVYNKLDKPHGALPQSGAGEGGCAFISAKTGEGVAELLELCERKLNSSRTVVDVLIPYGKYEAASFIKSEGRVISETHEESGTRIKAQLDESSLWRLRRMME